MYRCKECGTEYETKPDYCDCGNDEFEIFVAPEKEEPAKPALPQKEIRIPQTKFNPQQHVHKKSYSEFDRIKEIFDPLSTIIFLLCIILSFVTIKYIGNPAPQENKSEPKKQEAVNIPSIDSYWDNTLPLITPPVKMTEQPKPVEEESFIRKITVPIQKAVQPAVTTKIVTQPQKNTVPKIQTQPQTQLQKPKQQAVNVQTAVKVNQPALVQTNKQSQTKTTAQNVPSANYSALTQRVQNNAQKSVTAQTQVKKQQTPQQVPQQTQSAQSASNMPVIRTTSTPVAQNQAQSRPQVVQPVVDEKALKQEFVNYKVSLRNTIGKKINFTHVVGDGECVVSFKINSAGKLINREFTKQSSNLTLNNAVYAAVNSTPSFTAPPAGYKNETLNLKVSFYNGNFDISLY